MLIITNIRANIITTQLGGGKLFKDSSKSTNITYYMECLQICCSCLVTSPTILHSKMFHRSMLKMNIKIVYMLEGRFVLQDCYLFKRKCGKN